MIIVILVAIFGGFALGCMLVRTTSYRRESGFQDAMEQVHRIKMRELQRERELRRSADKLANKS
jgi:H+/Cl- antiporter ClcA